MTNKFYYQAIEVKYIGATNTKGSRYKAFCDAGSITVERDYSLSDNDQIAAVAKQLIKKLGWNNSNEVWVGGSLKNGNTVFTAMHKDGCIKFDEPLKMSSNMVDIPITKGWEDRF